MGELTWYGNNKIFKTYAKGNPNGDGKSPAEKVKGLDSIREFQDAAQFECFGAILKDDVIDISFDTTEMYETFLDMAEQNDWKCLCLPSSKGGHTYWKNKSIAKGGRDKKLAVGLIGDIHNKGTYIPLRVHGADRFPPDYDIYDDEEYDEVPAELLPVTTNIELWGMDEGDGRNEDLFKYILILQSQLSLDNDTIRGILKNANEYVLANPLSEDELDIILRDEAFQKPVFFSGSTFMFDKFATYLVNACHVVKINNQLHIYEDGIYYNGYREIETVMIQHIPNLKKTQRREVIDYMELIARPMKQADARYIAFRNGIYDITTDEIIEPNPEIVITNKVDWNYNTAAYDELGDTTLNKLACQDGEIRALLEECIGYCLYRRNELGKAFILTGDKSNGKSTFLDVVKAILGDENISALDLKELGDRFSTSMMFGKLANIGDDIGDDFLQGNQVAVFKKVVTGNRIKAERKGQDPFEFNPYVKLLFSANDIPRMKDKTGAVLRRLVIVPFNASFSKKDPDYKPFIKYDLVQEKCIEYFINIGIQGLKRILINNEFTNSKKVQKQLDGYEEENNPIVAFLAEADIDDIVNEQTSDVYRRYQVFCTENNMQPMGNIVFSRQLCKRLGLTTTLKRIDGKNCRVFEEL